MVDYKKIILSVAPWVPAAGGLYVIASWANGRDPFVLDKEKAIDPDSYGIDNTGIVALNGLYQSIASSVVYVGISRLVQ